jgi:hypothetical protein
MKPIGYIFAAAVLVCATLHAQLSLTIIVRTPTPAQLSIWQNDPSVVQLIIVNSGGTHYSSVRVSFTVTDQYNTTVAQSVDNSPNMPRFDIFPNSTTTKFGKDVINQNAVTINQSYRTKVITTNSLPEGSYQLCVHLLDQNGNQIAAGGLNCASFTVVIPDPPTLLLPADMSTVKIASPPTFTWTPVNIGGGQQTKYKLVIAPMYQGQTPKMAVEQNQPLFDKTLTANSYFYSQGNPPFSFYPSAKGFAWQVQALDPNGQPAARNDGKSEIFSFTVDTSTAQGGSGQQQGGGGQQQGGACLGPCTVAAPKNTTPGGSFKAGDSIQVGQFQMILTQVSGTGSALSGLGTISVPFLKAPVIVTFSNIKVNTNKQMYDGEVYGLRDNGSPISQSSANQLGNMLGMSQQDIKNVYDYASQGARLVSALSSSTPTSLPVGLDVMISNDRLVIAVIGMVFTPTKASLNAVTMFMMPDLGPDVGIGLGARDICFHPHGLSMGEGILYLPTDVGYANPNSFGFVFKGQTQNDSGSYVRWDCNGFKELRLKADVTFPRDWLVPDPDNNQQVKAHFVTTIRKKRDWMASAELDKCTISGADGFGLEVVSMYFDHSDVQNPAGMTFPQGYAGTTGTDWHGFYIKTATVTLPKSLKTFKNSPPTISVNDLLIDGTGMSGVFLALNIIQYPEGDFGGWGASIDTIEAKFVSSSLQKGGLGGRIWLPICDQNKPLKYYALLSRPKGPNGQLAFQFVIQPSGDIKADLWMATLTLGQTSYIKLDYSSNTFLAEAKLDGMLSVSGDLKNVPLVNLLGIKFEGFRVMSKSPYIVPGSWSLASGQHSVAGFPVSIDSIRPQLQVGNPLKLGVAFTLKLNFMGEQNGIAGSSRLAIWGKMTLASGVPQHFDFDGVELQQVDINADLGAVEINGSLKLYNGDYTYGNGFRGSIKATFAKLMTANATAQFGSVNNYRYWYVDAMVILASGLPIGSTGAAIFGFGGGAWYHMTRTEPNIDLHDSPNAGNDPTSAPADGGATPGITNTGASFKPDAGVGFGFKAGITIGTVPAGVLFNGDVSFSMEFLDGGGVKSASLDGAGYFVSPGIDQRKEAMLLATVDISYDFTKQVFEGNFGIKTNGSVEAILKVKAWLNFHIDPQNWHVLIGTPSKRIGVTILNFANFDAYFMAGTDIPPPDFNNFPHKQDIETAIGSALPTVHPPFSGGPTQGFAFGASVSIDTKDQCFLVVCGRLYLGAGFDIACNFDPTVVCSNTNKAPGIDGWYASGQLYAYAGGYVAIDIGFAKIKLVDLGAGVRCVVMAPNPTWVQGTLGGHFSAMGGMISRQFTFTFEVGDKCTISVENPIAKLQWITDMQPGDGAQNVPVFATPTAKLIFPVDQPVDLQTVDEQGQEKLRTFRLEVESFTIQDENGNPVEGVISYPNDDPQTVKLVPKEVLPGETNLSCTILVRAEEYIIGNWTQAKLRNGSDAKQSQTVNFRSDKRPEEVVPEFVMFTYPINRQKNFLQDEIRTGRIGTKQGYLFDQNQYPGDYLVRFKPIDGGDSVETPCWYDKGGNAIVFNIPQLANEKRYAIQVLRRIKGGIIPSSAMTYAPALSQSWNKTVASNLGHRSGQVSQSSVLYQGGGISNVSQYAQVSAATYAAALTLDVKKLPGLEVRPDEKLLYHYYFRTSKFNTLKQKVDDMTFTKTDTWKYGNWYVWQYQDIFQAVYPHFSASEGWDDYEVYGYWEQLPWNLEWEYQKPLITVSAPSPDEYWYESFAAPIYNHILLLKVYGLWDPNLPLTSDYNALFGFVNFDNSVLFTGHPTGILDTTTYSWGMSLQQSSWAI